MQRGMAESPAGTSEWWHRLECVLQQNISNVSLNERIMLVQSIFQNVCTEVKKQEGLRKQPFVFNNVKRVVIFHQVVPLCINNWWKTTGMFRTWHWSVPTIIGTLQCHVLSILQLLQRCGQSNAVASLDFVCENQVVEWQSLSKIMQIRSRIVRMWCSGLGLWGTLYIFTTVNQ